jgi:hypothetical protein
MKRNTNVTVTWGVCQNTTHFISSLLLVLFHFFTTFSRFHSLFCLFFYSSWPGVPNCDVDKLLPWKGESRHFDGWNVKCCQQWMELLVPLQSCVPKATWWKLLPHLLLVMMDILSLL